MNIVINLWGKFVTIVDVKARKVVALIENDVGIIRYILKILREYEISNNNGYLQFENKEGETYLHRIVLEYYSQFDDKLFTILNNLEYEVNHKNKNKWDNTLSNLEFVTRTNNERHKRGLEYQTVMTTEEILQIKNKLKEEKQYQADKKYLEKVSHKNLEYLSNGNYKKDLFDNLYIRFSNKTIQQPQTPQNITLSNTLTIFTNIIFENTKNTFFIPSKTYSIKYYYDRYKSINLLNNNLQLIFKYYGQDKYFREVCKKYKILDHKYIKKYKQEKITFEEYIGHNIIIDLFYYLLPNRVDKTFSQNQLSTIIALNSLILTYKRYNPFKVLYLLQLLNRRTVHYYNDLNIPLNKKLKSGFKRKINLPTGFFIPKYTDELFTTTILPLAKQLYYMDLSKITYTIIAKNFGFKTADSIYKNSNTRLKTKSKTDFITIDDTISILLTSSTLRDKLQHYGFITINDIRYELQLLNQARKENGRPFIEVKDADTKFITGIVINVTEIRKTLDQLNIEFVRLNPKTIENIKNHQKQNKTEITPLSNNQTRIVLKDLIVKTPKNRKIINI